MCIADDWNVNQGLFNSREPIVPLTNGCRPLHRVGEVRRQQGVSLRSAARRLGTSVDDVRRQEQASCDMSLKELYRWQQALEVPVTDLLVEAEGPLSQPVLTRARLLRVMKTARAIHESTHQVPIQRLSSMLEQQLIELMPELKDVSAWHSVGQRRTKDELGRIAEQPIPSSLFMEPLE